MLQFIFFYDDVGIYCADQSLNNQSSADSPEIFLNVYCFRNGFVQDSLAYRLISLNACRYDVGLYQYAAVSSSISLSACWLQENLIHYHISSPSISLSVDGPDQNWSHCNIVSPWVEENASLSQKNSMNNGSGASPLNALNTSCFLCLFDP